MVLVDEGTANLDQETESAIQTVLRTAFRTSTVLLIAHRLSGLEYMRRIFVMDDGRIVEVGTPEELAKNSNSLYYKLLEEQGIVTNYNAYKLVPI